MDYEIVTLEEKEVAGLNTRTSNSAADMGKKIGSLWNEFFENGIYGQVAGKVNDKTIGLYTNYASDENGDYDMYVCCEVNAGAAQADGVEKTVIPRGPYAKFIVKGNMVSAVHEFWVKLWNMDLDRRYSGDFEEYQPCLDGDMENCEIHMYISLKS